MKRITIAVLAFMCPLVSAQTGQAPLQPVAEQPGEALPAAEDVFARHLEAIGGAEALRGHKNRLSRGKVESTSSFALVSTWQEAPGRLRTRFESPGQQSIDTVFSDGYGWKIFGTTRGELVRNEKLRELRDDADFLADIEFDRRYEKMETVRIRTHPEDGSRAYEVRVTFPYGKVETHFFDVDSGLRMATLTSMLTPDGHIMMSIAYGDYRSVSGVLVAHELIITSNPGREDEQKSVIEFTQIRANVPSVPKWDMPPSLAEIIKRAEAEDAASGSGGSGG